MAAVEAFVEEIEEAVGPIEVAIDINPGGDRNPVRPSSRQKVRVAILTTDDFDATEVDPLSVRFGPLGAISWRGRAQVEDVDRDGDADLVLRFDIVDAGFECGDTEASVTGTTWTGQAIEGTDAIVTVGYR